MQLKEAIDYLMPIMENARLDGYHLALRKVLEAAELQIAKVPEEHNNFYRCPNCQNTVMHGQCNCEDCGQLIGWDEEQWQPNIGETYWTYATHEGMILPYTWRNNAIDIFRFKNNIVFKTFAVAEGKYPLIKDKIKKL